MACTTSWASAPSSSTLGILNSLTTVSTPLTASAFSIACDFAQKRRYRPRQGDLATLDADLNPAQVALARECAHNGFLNLNGGLRGASRGTADMEDSRQGQ